MGASSERWPRCIVKTQPSESFSPMNIAQKTCIFPIGGMWFKSTIILWMLPSDVVCQYSSQNQAYWHLFYVTLFLLIVERLTWVKTRLPFPHFVLHKLWLAFFWERKHSKSSKRHRPTQLRIPNWIPKRTDFSSRKYLLCTSGPGQNNTYYPFPRVWWFVVFDTLNFRSTQSPVGPQENLKNIYDPYA